MFQNERLSSLQKKVVTDKLQEKDIEKWIKNI